LSSSPVHNKGEAVKVKERESGEMNAEETKNESIKKEVVIDESVNPKNI